MGTWTLLLPRLWAAAGKGDMFGPHPYEEEEEEEEGEKGPSGQIKVALAAVFFQLVTDGGMEWYVCFSSQM